MHCSKTGFPVLYNLLEFAQTHVHLVDDAIQPSFALFSSCSQSFPASGSFPLSWLFASDGQSIRASASASVPPMNIHDIFPLALTDLISLMSKAVSRVFSSTTVLKHQFFGSQPSLWFNSHICTWLLETPQLWLNGPLSEKCCLCFLICSLGLTQVLFQRADIL